MKRLTLKDENGCFLTDKTATVMWNPLIGENRYRGEAVDRLAAIEDILGDEYDLDRLRELVQADREGWCVVFAPDYPVGSIYYKDVDGNYIREASGVVTTEEYEAALRREQE